MQNQVLNIRKKDPRAAAIVFAVLTIIVIGLIIAGIIVCGKDIGTLSISGSLGGFTLASASVTVGFNALTTSASAAGRTASGSISVDSSQACPSSNYNSFTGWFGMCQTSSGSWCVPPAPFGMWAGSKASAGLACLFLFILVVLCFTKKQSGCAICGLSWLAMILTSISVALAANGALTFITLCFGGINSSVEYSTGNGAKLFAGAIVLQFIFWIVAQCTAVPASGSQTVVIMQNQPAQMYAPNMHPMQPIVPQYAQPAQRMAPQYPQLDRPLPPGWEVLTDSSGNRYYGNPTTRITQYEFPNA
jgi:hypothetical protein